MLEISTAGKIALLVAVPTTFALLYWLLNSRDGEEEDYGEQVTSSRQTTVEIVVPRNAVGVVIGRQGANIKEVQKATGARIHFKDRDDPGGSKEDRRVIIQGSSTATQQAEAIIRKTIADMPVLLTEEVYVPVKALGRIIGRNGESIREMSRMSKAKIDIARGDESDKNGVNLVTITGARQNIDMAKSLLEEKVQQEEAYRTKMTVSATNRDGRSARRKNVHEEQKSVAAPQARGPVEEWDHELHAESKDRKDFLEVYVSAVENPGHFWAQILSSKSVQLDQLCDNLNRFYATDAEPEVFSIPSLSVGDIVAAPFEHDNAWYRARVVGFDDDNVDLFYVDYGDNGLVHKDNVRHLRGDFLSLPFQAVECFLANVKPKDDTWTEESCEVFEELTYTAQWKVIIAETIRYQHTERGPVPCLRLINTNGAQDVNVNEELVRRGFAKWDASSSQLQEDADLPGKEVASNRRAVHGV